MNSRERFHGFVTRSRIDRVPVQLQNFIVAAQSTGQSYPVVCRSADLIAQGHLREWEKYRHDGIIVDIGTHVAAESLGCEVKYEPDELPRVVKGAIEEWDSRDTLLVPNIPGTPPLSTVIEAVRLLKKEVGDHATVIGTVDQGPFTLTTQIAGLEKTLLALAVGNHDSEIFDIISHCEQFTYRFGVELAKAGADVVRMGDSISGPDLISPAMYRKYALPAQTRLARRFKAEGITFCFHICGDATPIISDMVSSEAAYLEIDEKTSLEAARDAVRVNGGIGGPISPRLLRFGTEAEVRTTCRDVLRRWMPHGGLFFGPGCSIIRDTPEENIKAMVESAGLYGLYAGETVRGD